VIQNGYLRFLRISKVLIYWRYMEIRRCIFITDKEQKAQPETKKPEMMISQVLMGHNFNGYVGYIHCGEITIAYGR